MELEKIKLGNKRAAIELSIGTIVIIVLAMSMLILGLVLVRNIFKGVTAIVDELNQQSIDSIIDLFSNTDEKIIVKLGAGQTIRPKADNALNNFLIGARTSDGSNVDVTTFKYKLSLDRDARENCITKINERKVEEFITQRLNTRLRFDKTALDIAFASIEVRIPEGTLSCSQKFRIEVEESGSTIATNFFIIDIVRK